MVNVSAQNFPSVQIQMEGIPLPVRSAPISLHDLRPGQNVIYVGYVSGGPRHGSGGVVRNTLRRGAMVDLGSAGTWRIPACFLKPEFKIA